MPDGSPEGNYTPKSNVWAEKEKAGGWVPLWKKLGNWFVTEVSKLKFW